MDTLYTGPVCLTKTDDYNTNFASGYGYGSDPLPDSANMFTPYVPYVSPFTESERESEQNRQAEDSSSGLFLS